LTFFYHGGQDKYQVEQTLAPDEQMWLDLGKLIRDQVPGKDGKTIPPEVTSGVYQIEDLTHVVLGPLYEAKLIVDKTNGHAFYGCYECCGDDGAVMGTIPINTVVNGVQGQTVWSVSQCHGCPPVNITSAMTSWWTNDTSIATASNAQVYGVAVGSTDNLAEGLISTSGFRTCGQMEGKPSAGTNVTPTIAQNMELWYFNGNSAPGPAAPNFTLGATSITLTAEGVAQGTFAWTVTKGPQNANATFSNGATKVTNTNVNTVQLTSTAQSFATADAVLISLEYTPPGGTTLPAVDYPVEIDAPYKLVGTGTTNAGAETTCQTVPAPVGTAGYQSLVGYDILSFFGVEVSNVVVAENFSNIQVVYQGNNWPGYLAGTAPTTTGAFVDNICVINATIPTSLPPQQPLSGVQVDQAFQTWHVGSVPGSAPGLTVQTDTLRRYQDHGLHAGITSPIW